MKNVENNTSASMNIQHSLMFDIFSPVFFGYFYDNGYTTNCFCFPRPRPMSRGFRLNGRKTSTTGNSRSPNMAFKNFMLIYTSCVIRNILYKL